MSISNKHYLIDQQIEPVNNYFEGRSKENTQHSNAQELKVLEVSKLKQWKTQNQGNLTHGSYQAILEQSLTTQDKHFLYEILTETNPEIIRNSLQDLPSKKVIDLLQMIKSLLENNLKIGKGQDNCLQISQWLKVLLKLHLSTIVSNPENKQTIESIRKLLVKRIQQRSTLLQIRSKLIRQDHHILNHAKKTYKPKFDYVQEEMSEIQEDPNNIMTEQDMRMEDEDEDGGFEDFEDDFGEDF